LGAFRGIMAAAGGCAWALGCASPGAMTPERRVEAAIVERAGVAPSTEPIVVELPVEEAVVEEPAPEEAPMAAPAVSEPEPAVEAPPPAPDPRALDEAGRVQLRQGGLAALALGGSADAVVAAALARNGELWWALGGLGVSASRVASRWTPDGNAAWPERRLAEVVETLAAAGAGWEARDAVGALAHRVRVASLRLQAAARALDLHSTHVRSFQAATALSRMDAAVADHAGERAAAQRARLELVRLQTEVASHQRELELLMGFAAGAPAWTPSPGPPALPPPRLDPRLEQAIASALRDRADLRSRREQAASDGPGEKARAAELELAIRSQVIDAHARMATARLVGEACRDALIPMHERIVELSLDRFNAGTVDAATLLSAQRELVTARRQEIESLRDYWIARADLLRATGQW